MRDENSQESSQSFGFAQHDVSVFSQRPRFQGDDEKGMLSSTSESRTDYGNTLGLTLLTQ